MRSSRALVIASLAVLLWCADAGAQFAAPGGVVPVVANLPGLANTYWRSDVNVLNVSETDTEVVLSLFPELYGGSIAAFEPVQNDPIELPAHQQLTLANVVQSQFGLVNTKGSLWLSSTSGAKLVISSRTYTQAATGGSYGQDVSSVLVAGEAWASGVQHDGFYRTNFGIFWPWDMGAGESVHFTVTVYSGDGEAAGSGTVNFTRAGLVQLSLGEIGVGTLLDGYVHFSCSDTTSPWYAYASRVDQVSGDAVFRIARGDQISGR